MVRKSVQHQEQTCLVWTPNWSSTRQDVSKPTWGLRLVLGFRSQHPLWLEDQARPSDHGAQSLESATFSMSPTTSTATNSVVPHPQAASSGCDKRRRGPHQLTSLCKTGCPAMGLLTYKPTEKRKKRGRAFRWWADCKVARGRREGQGCAPRAPSYGCCGHSVSVGLRTLKNWRKGEVLDKTQKCKELSTVSHRVIASELLDGEGPKNRHEQDFFSA